MNYLNQAKLLLDILPDHDDNAEDFLCNATAAQASALVAIAERMDEQTGRDEHIIEVDKRMSRIQDVQSLFIERLEKAEARPDRDRLDEQGNALQGLHGRIQQAESRLADIERQLDTSLPLAGEWQQCPACSGDSIEDMEPLQPTPLQRCDVCGGGGRIRVPESEQREAQPDLWAKLEETHGVAERAAKARWQAQERAEALERQLRNIIQVVQDNRDLNGNDLADLILDIAS